MNTKVMVFSVVTLHIPCCLPLTRLPLFPADKIAVSRAIAPICSPIAPVLDLPTIYWVQFYLLDSSLD
jgi:hypothetical protein